jgi:cytochrome c oxidase assembly factor CtaG
MPGGIVQALAPLAIALLYHRRCAELARRRSPVPRYRRVLFYAGIALTLVAVEPPIEGLDDELLVVHMVQHLLLGDLGPLLVVMGLTGPVLAPMLRLPGLSRLRALAHPGIALPLWAVNLYAWHVPALYQLAVEHDAVHALEHGMFFSLSVLMWMALLGPLPSPAWFGNIARLMYILGMFAVEMVLASGLVWAGRVLYPDYVASDLSRGVRPLTDQGLAGAVMMLQCTLVMAGLFTWVFLRALRQMEERQSLLDLAAARGVALSEQRAARAVNAGVADRLRERLLAGEGAGRRWLAEDGPGPPSER